MSSKTSAIESLVALGFAELEAHVYTYLVGHSPATGYRVSHAIGKPIANTYKAIESLHQKGAVMIDESGDNRQVFAVRPDELLSQLADAFGDRHRAAHQALQNLEPSDHGVGLYTLSNADQVVSRAKAMLKRAEDVVLCDLFPRALDTLRRELEETAGRGVAVVVKVYEPTVVVGVETVVSPRGTDLITGWPGQWMNIVVDETELLLSFLNKESSGVHQAIWSGSPFLSVVYHIAFSWEITGSRIQRALQAEDVTIEHMRSLIADFRRLETPGARGYQQVSGLKHFGDGQVVPEPSRGDEPAEQSNTSRKK
jgi:sugar-specific transcriptional regulator TrmB